MATRIGATRLARRWGDVLRRIRYRRESFLVERNGVLVARIEPVRPVRLPSLREVVEAWSAVEADPDFAEDLATVGAADAPALDPCA
jgi:antitoxin (DNA-binding transcriptional repressor) of toxin-antitoxin stability system